MLSWQHCLKARACGDASDSDISLSDCDFDDHDDDVTKAAGKSSSSSKLRDLTSLFATVENEVCFLILPLLDFCGWSFDCGVF